MTSTSSAARMLAALLALAPLRVGASAGNGIRLGGSEGRLHPYLEVEGRWDSNVYYTGTSSVGDLILHVRPGFKLGVPGDLVSVDLDGNLDWAEYLGLKDSATEDLSRAYGAATLGLAVNRHGTVGLELDDKFVRDANTTAWVFQGAVVSNRNELAVKVPWRPGGGALVLAFVGGWTLETYQPFHTCGPGVADPSCDKTILDGVSYNEVRGGGEVRWKFLPRTAAVVEASYFSHQPKDTTIAPELSGLDGRAGVTGLVTPHVSATLKAGYMDSLDSGPKSWGTWLATLEGEWLASESATLKIGWDHGYGIDPGNVLSLYGTHRVLLDGRYALGGRYGARLGASYEHRAYAFQGSADGNLVHVEPAIEAALSRWMNVSFAYAYTRRSSTLSSAPGFDYTKNEVWLRFALTY